ncbi:phosphate starvation-inducible protein [Serratia phage vB_SmaS-Totoro]|nr:phosphate starvation-inducible protein [Serratia phage vB_SmaS-Totoro]
MGRQKAATVKRRDVRKAKRQANRGFESNLVEFPTNDNGFASHESIGMAKCKKDTRPIEPRNDNQALYLNALELSDLIVATGSAGSGKTFLASAYAVEQLSEKRYEKIIVTRPMVTAEEEMGFLPGDANEKFAPYFRPVYDILRKRMGDGWLKYCLREEIGKVEIAPFAFMRGRTFEDAIVILDEAQNVTVNQMRLFLTRVGENVTIIVNGDPNQCDLPKGTKSGLVDLINRIKSKSIDVPIIEFTDDDCVRSKLCSTALDIYK